MTLHNESASMNATQANSTSVLVIGATSAIAEHCARRWCEDGASSITLIGRDAAKLQRVQLDLQARYPSVSLFVRHCPDFLNERSVDESLDEVFATTPPAIVLIAHGDLPDQAACQVNSSALRRAVEINGVSPLLWLEGVVHRLEQRDAGGSVAVIGSVAGDRGRQSNYVYGAAKGLLDRYAEGIQHRLALSRSKVRVSIIKPGPTATPMTAHLQAQGQKMATAEAVAQRVVVGMRNAKPTVYAPAKWRWIMLVIRYLPRFVFHRLKI